MKAWKHRKKLFNLKSNILIIIYLFCYSISKNSKAFAEKLFLAVEGEIIDLSTLLCLQLVRNTSKNTCEVVFGQRQWCRNSRNRFALNVWLKWNSFKKRFCIFLLVSYTFYYISLYFDEKLTKSNFM